MDERVAKPVVNPVTVDLREISFRAAEDLYLSRAIAAARALPQSDSELLDRDLGPFIVTLRQTIRECWKARDRLPPGTNESAQISTLGHFLIQGIWALTSAVEFNQRVLMGDTAPLVVHARNSSITQSLQFIDLLMSLNIAPDPHRNLLFGTPLRTRHYFGVALVAVSALFCEGKEQQPSLNRAGDPVIAKNDVSAPLASPAEELESMAQVPSKEAHPLRHPAIVWADGDPKESVNLQISLAQLRDSLAPAHPNIGGGGKPGLLDPGVAFAEVKSLSADSYSSLWLTGIGVPEGDLILPQPRQSERISDEPAWQVTMIGQADSTAVLPSPMGSVAQLDTSLSQPPHDALSFPQSHYTVYPAQEHLPSARAPRGAQFQDGEYRALVEALSRGGDPEKLLSAYLSGYLYVVSNSFDSFLHPANFSSTEIALGVKIGDCDVLSHIAASALRDAGIPSVIATGYLEREGKLWSKMLHARVMYQTREGVWREFETTSRTADAFVNLDLMEADWLRLALLSAKWNPQASFEARDAGYQAFAQALREILVKDAYRDFRPEYSGMRLSWEELLSPSEWKYRLTNVEQVVVSTALGLGVSGALVGGITGLIASRARISRRLRAELRELTTTAFLNDTDNARHSIPGAAVPNELEDEFRKSAQNFLGDNSRIDPTQLRPSALLQLCRLVAMSNRAMTVVDDEIDSLMAGIAAKYRVLRAVHREEDVDSVASGLRKLIVDPRATQASSAALEQDIADAITRGTQLYSRWSSENTGERNSSTLRAGKVIRRGAREQAHFGLRAPDRSGDDVVRFEAGMSPHRIDQRLLARTGERYVRQQHSRQEASPNIDALRIVVHVGELSRGHLAWLAFVLFRATAQAAQTSVREVRFVDGERELGVLGGPPAARRTGEPFAPASWVRAVLTKAAELRVQHSCNEELLRPKFKHTSSYDLYPLIEAFHTRRGVSSVIVGTSWAPIVMRVEKGKVLRELVEREDW